MILSHYSDKHVYIYSDLYQRFIFKIYLRKKTINMSKLMDFSCYSVHNIKIILYCSTVSPSAIINLRVPSNYTAQHSRVYSREDAYITTNGRDRVYIGVILAIGYRGYNIRTCAFP